MTKQGEKRLLKVGILACILVIASILLSGPIGMPLVLFTKSQPAWTNPETFVANFSFIQTVPYFFGFLLTTGSILLITSTYKLAKDDDKALMLPSIIFASIYASLISLNYIIQTTFAPALATHYSPELGVIVSAFSMSNPKSLAWAIEMYGYAFLGLALLFLLPFFKGNKMVRILRWLVIINALVSVLSAIVTSSNLSWVLTTTGLISFFVWNILYLAIVGLMLEIFKKRLKTL